MVQMIKYTRVSVSASIKADILTFMCVNTMPQPSQQWTSQPEQGTSMACFKVYLGETLFSLSQKNTSTVGLCLIESKQGWMSSWTMFFGQMIKIPHGSGGVLKWANCTHSSYYELLYMTK